MPFSGSATMAPVATGSARATSVGANVIKKVATKSKNTDEHNITSMFAATNDFDLPDDTIKVNKN